MASTFQTEDRHAQQLLKPLRVAGTQASVFQEARNLASELPGWKVLEVDESKLSIRCERAGGFLRGAALVTITVEGPAGIPSATVNVRSETRGGPFARDRANVLEFMRRFERRVC